MVLFCMQRGIYFLDRQEIFLWKRFEASIYFFSKKIFFFLLWKTNELFDCKSDELYFREISCNLKQTKKNKTRKHIETNKKSYLTCSLLLMLSLLVDTKNNLKRVCCVCILIFLLLLLFIIVICQALVFVLFFQHIHNIYMRLQLHLRLI